MNTVLSNARLILRDIDMQHLHPAHGAAVEIVRWCLVVRSRPTHRRQAFLEMESPTLLAYLEKVASSGNSVGWRTLENRIRLRAEILRETGMNSCSRPWQAAIWHTLPELAKIGQAILDQQTEKRILAPGSTQTVPESNGGAGDGGGEGEMGSAGKAGSAGTTAKPRPALRLALPAAPIVLTGAEKMALGLSNDASTDDKTDATPEGPDGTDGDGGTSGPAGMGGGI
jgi:hypothetical protein